MMTDVFREYHSRIGSGEQLAPAGVWMLNVSFISKQANIPEGKSFWDAAREKGSDEIVDRWSRSRIQELKFTINLKRWRIMQSLVRLSIFNSFILP